MTTDDTTTTQTQEETMGTEYWTRIGGQTRTSHTTISEAVHAIIDSWPDEPYMVTVGDGMEPGTVVAIYRSRTRADADRDGAYPDASVERVEV